MNQGVPSHHTPGAPHAHYYVPDHSYWPIIGAVGLGILVWGLVGMIHDISKLHHILTFGLGVAIMVTLVAGWFHSVVKESMGGLYSPQMDRSFRIAMIWFIFSEVMFFLAFFGALFFVRQWALPWLSGAGHYELTGQLLWPEFVYNWPLLQNPDTSIVGPKGTIPPMGIPLINTLLLLTSGVTVTWAHYALKKQQRTQLNLGLFLTIALAIVFLGFQVYEFGHAYNDLGLTLASGIYGSTFFMLTGFHGLHVTIGTIMLIVILLRSLVGHFSPDHHFAFEATAWYWHFVDVVWVGLFIFVYIF